jgi:N-carbamoyl-L-amino-acid hydrolase
VSVAFNLPPDFAFDESAIQIGIERQNAIGSDPKHFGVLRPAFSSEERVFHQHIHTRGKQELGLSARVDAVGNLFLTRPGYEEGLPAIFITSHGDTVGRRKKKNWAGRFDGPAGVEFALQVLEDMELRDIRTRHPITFMLCAGEEASRFPGVALIGSKLYTGKLQPHELLHLKDDDDISFAEALRLCGLAPEQLNSVPPTKPLNEVVAAVLELHIEQGLVCTEEGVPFGIANRSAGYRRYSVKVKGAANHTGTTPPDLTHDAILAISMLRVALFDAIMAQGEGVTRGTLTNLIAEGALSIVPDEAIGSIDIRDVDASRTQRVVKVMREAVVRISEKTRTEIIVDPIIGIEPSPLDGPVFDALKEAADSRGETPFELPCWAGHDLFAFRGCDVPIGLLLIRSNGWSHNGELERAEYPDLARSFAVGYQGLLNLDMKLNRSSSKDDA